MKLDKKDMQILSILDWNARTPISQIAKQTRLNKDVVRYRIRNLEKNGVLEGYFTLINTHKLGYITIRLYFDFIDVTEGIQRRIIDFLDKKFDAGQIFTTDGEYQLGIITWEKSVFTLDKKLKHFKELFGDYINKDILSIFTTFHHYPRKIFSNNLKNISLKEEKTIIQLKKNDVNILQELSKNARISSSELSVKLNIPQRTIAHRIKELEKQHIILGYRAQINIKSLGYENYFLEIYTHKGQEIREIEMFAKNHKNCISSDIVFPGADIELETEFRNKTELWAFLNQLKAKFKSIKKIKYWSTLTYEKTNYLPKV